MDSGRKQTLVGVVSKRLFENNCNQVRHAILFSTVLSLLSQHLAYIQTLPTTSPGSKSRSKEFFCIIIIEFFFARVIIVEQVKENGGMASCSGLLGSPPSLGRIAFGKSDQSQIKYFGANIIFLTVKNLRRQRISSHDLGTASQSQYVALRVEVPCGAAS